MRRLAATLAIGLAAAAGAPGSDEAPPASVALPPELARGGEVIGVGVGLDDVVDADALLGGKREIAIDLIQRRIDEQAGARLLAADQIRQAAAGAHLFEEHGACCARSSVRSRGVPPSRRRS